MTNGRFKLRKMKCWQLPQLLAAMNVLYPRGHDVAKYVDGRHTIRIKFEIYEAGAIGSEDTSFPVSFVPQEDGANLEAKGDVRPEYNSDKSIVQKKRFGLGYSHDYPHIANTRNPNG